MRSHVFLQVVLPTEAFTADDTRMRTKSRVDPLVPRQLFVSGERLATTFRVAFERPLTSVYANVSFELPVIAKRDVAVLAPKLLRPQFLHLLRDRVLSMKHLHGLLHRWCV